MELRRGPRKKGSLCDTWAICEAVVLHARVGGAVGVARLRWRGCGPLGLRL